MFESCLHPWTAGHGIFKPFDVSMGLVVPAETAVNRDLGFVPSKKSLLNPHHTTEGCKWVWSGSVSCLTQAWSWLWAQPKLSILLFIIISYYIYLCNQADGYLCMDLTGVGPRPDYQLDLKAVSCPDFSGWVPRKSCQLTSLPITMIIKQREQVIYRKSFKT